MRGCRWASCWLLALCVGCGPASTVHSNVAGIKIEVLHPRFSGRVESTTRSSADANAPMVYVHSWIPASGPPQTYTVEIQQSKLSINAKPYGTVSEGDHLLIDGDRVLINGTPRNAG